MSAVEDLLTERKIAYQVSGRDVLVCCLNPDHDDKHPSMRIDRVLGIFNCFACGYRGNLFKHYNVEASKVGIKREKLIRLITEIKSSGVGLSMPEGYIEFYKDWRGISKETYKKFEAFYHYEKDFSGRVNFPIKDSSGRIVAFQGRDESGTLQSKYRFTPSKVKLPIYPIVQPLQGRVILVEGIFDMLNLHDKDLTNAVCCFGASNFNLDKLHNLQLSGVTGLDILFDADEAGRAGAEKIKKIAGEFPVRVITLKTGDPGEMTKQQVVNLRNNLYS